MAKYSQSTDLNYVDIDPLYRSHDLTNWNTLLPPHEADDEKTDLTQLLLNERQRLSSTKGVTSYSVAANRILFSSNSLYQFSDMNPDTKRMNRTSIPKAENRPIIDPKISPDNQNVCAYYSQNDLYVQDLTKGRFSRYQKMPSWKILLKKNFLQNIHFRKIWFDKNSTKTRTVCSA